MENRTSFGLDASSYRSYRPTYPEALYEYLAQLCPARNAVLDVACGNGQAASALCRYFERVVATDVDAAQIASAPAHDQIEYRVVSAEALPADLGRFDLVTIAQGAHWFDLDLFYRRLVPLLNDGAVVAIWGYSFGRIDAEIDALIQTHLKRSVDPYWAEGNRVIMDHYRTIAFPYAEIDVPPFFMVSTWDRADFFGFVRTWSAYKRLIAAGHADPLIALGRALDDARLWPEDQTREVRFELHMRVGRRMSVRSFRKLLR